MKNSTRKPKRRHSVSGAAPDELARRHHSVLKVVGSLADADIPGWETAESAAAWVHAARHADQARLNEVAFLPTEEGTR
jgi:hypothetical protein